MRLRSSWPNSIGAASENVIENTYEGTSSSYRSTARDVATNAAPIRNAATSRRPSSTVPAVNVTKIVTKNGLVTLSVTCEPSRTPESIPPVARATATSGARRRSASARPKPLASTNPSASFGPGSPARAASSTQISAYTTAPTSASRRYGGSARTRARRVPGTEPMASEW